MEEKCRIADLRYKEVIRVSSGERLGYVSDAEFDLKDGQVLSLVVPGELRFFGLLGRKEDTVILWNQIDRIGDDIILIK